MKTRFYGAGGTIHSTTDINVEVHKGKVLAVWFRCQPLPFTQSDFGSVRAKEMKDMYEDSTMPGVYGVTLIDE